MATDHRLQGGRGDSMNLLDRLKDKWTVTQKQDAHDRETSKTSAHPRKDRNKTKSHLKNKRKMVQQSRRKNR